MPDRALRPLRPTRRDAEIVDDIRLSGVLGIEHVEQFHFTGISRARRRMAALEAAGYVRRLIVPTGPRTWRSAFVLGPEGSVLLSSFGLADRRDAARASRKPLGRMLVEHSLGVAAVRAALIRSDGPLPVSFRREPEVSHVYDLVRAGAAERRVFRPDGLFLIGGGPEPFAAFVEFDTGAASNKKWASACRSYRDYVELGLFQQEYGGSGVAVLVVTLGGRGRVSRLMSIAKASSGPSFYIAALSEVLSGGFGGEYWWGAGGKASLARIAGGIP